MLIAAGYLGCEPIIEAASEFMKQRINVENVIDVIQVAKSLSCANLGKSAREYMDRYFYDVINSDTWLECPANLACSILSSSNLYVESEVVVWKAFKQLIQSNREFKGTFPLS